MALFTASLLLTNFQTSSAMNTTLETRIMVAQSRSESGLARDTD